MTSAHLEVLVEEPSMEVAMRILLPKMIPALTFEVHSFQCKSELLNRLPSRLQGYRAWLPQNYRILVLVDRDQEDCFTLKRTLESYAKQKGLRSASTSKGGSWEIANRIVIEELEAWYFGDWQAVKTAYPLVDSRIPNKAGLRDPDAIAGGTWEKFQAILQDAGYFKGGLRKLEAARSITPHMDPQRNRSRSFQAMRSLLEGLPQT